MSVHCTVERQLSIDRSAQLPQCRLASSQDYDERVLPSIGNEVLKAIVAQYNADQLLTMREKVDGAVAVGTALHVAPHIARRVANKTALPTDRRCRGRPECDLRYDARFGHFGLADRPPP